jgi:dynactin complex subunit
MCSIHRFLGYVDGEERVGIELKENLGDCDGTFRGKFYFKW